MKRCSKCKIIKKFELFSKRKKSKDGYDHYCKECHSKYGKHKYKTDIEYKNRIKIRNLKNRYGLNESQLNLLLTKEHCEICGVKLIKKRNIDHCQKTNVVRGILCPKCNTLLGQANDDINILKNAITYLNKAIN